MRIFGVILAGGGARRMGGVDKAGLMLGGESLIARCIARLEPQVERLAISANGDPARFGFGLPVLEAMSSGVPVACAASSALPELCAGSALQADPHDIDAMAAALERTLEDDSWRAAAIARGLERSAGFTWQRTTAAVVDVFRELVA